MMIKKKKPERLDVDTRFLLANERTLLAWVRTSLAVEAGGIALAALHTHQVFLGVSVLLMGSLVALIGYHRFLVADKSIRAGKMPPTGSGPAIQVFGIVAIAVILAVAQITIL